MDGSRTLDTETNGIRERLIRQLLAEESSVSTSAFGRLSRTAWAALRNRGLFDPAGPGSEEVALEDVARLVGSLGELKGVAMKMGQILSYIDLALPPDVREALSTLQTHAQPMRFHTVQSVIHDQLPATSNRLLETMHPTPISAASIGQVHRAQPDEDPVAVKVQYPGIEDAIRSDFRAARIGPAIASLIYPGASIQGLIQEARDRLLDECDYAREARMQQRFAEIYQDHPVIEVPRIHPEYSARRVLTSTYIDGDSFDTFLASDPPQATRNRMGEALFEFYIGTLFEHGLFNGDPHPGNYLFKRPDRLVLLDHGCVRSFEPPLREALARISHGMRHDDDAQLREALLELGMIDQDNPDQFATAKRLLEGFMGPMRRDQEAPIHQDDAIQMRAIVAKKRDLMKLQIPPAFLFLFRIRFGLASVLSQLGAKANWAQLEAEYADPLL